MKFTRIYIWLAAMVLFASIVIAQGVGSPNRTRNYDPATETTVTGTVEEVSHQAGRNGVNGTHLILKTDGDTLDVHVGPSDFISKQQFSFAKGDHVEVTGPKVKIGQTNALIAREIKKNGKVLTLRNPQGVPAWSRGRQPR